ncbi:hypothetical protein [uncultured Salinisphaera sp.]|uniref:hypothetical protein n=1 Tax=uncultured Salinisphaera sp. TaxID=359372 RepID=UPI0032B17225
MGNDVILSGFDGASQLDLWVLALKIMSTGITATLSVLFVVFTLSLRKPGQRERRAAYHFVVASVFATLYIGADTAVRASAVLGSVDDVLVFYRLELCAVPLSIVGYVNLGDPGTVCGIESPAGERSNLADRAENPLL